MPRRTTKKLMSRKGPSPADRGKGERRRAPAAVSDDQVLELRETGDSFSAIARQLELPRAAHAHAAFLRALRAREGADRRELVGRETERLDRLEQRIRRRDAAQPEKLVRRLKALDILRETLPT